MMEGILFIIAWVLVIYSSVYASLGPMEVFTNIGGTLLFTLIVPSIICLVRKSLKSFKLSWSYFTIVILAVIEAGKFIETLRA
jgi:hypothetical protein